jgi:hypothetical protein
MRAERAQANRIADRLGADTTPELANLEAVLALVRPGVLPYGGLRYSVAPVPYGEGLECQSMLLDLKRLSDGPQNAESLERTRALCARAIAIFPRLTQPRGWMRRLFWPITPNPFRRATVADVRTLLGFFYLSAMRSSVGDLSESTAPPVP